jgi:hypothetical protein
MECREFRDLLLLLQGDLEEKDIPHRTKVREAIITAWKSWFVGLKGDLAVRVTRLYWCTVTDLIFRKQLDKSASLQMYGLTVTVVGISPSPVIGLHGTRPLDGSNSGEHWLHFIASVAATMERPWQMLLCIFLTALVLQLRCVINNSMAI